MYQRRLSERGGSQTQLQVATSELLTRMLMWTWQIEVWRPSWCSLGWCLADSCCHSAKKKVVRVVGKLPEQIVPESNNQTGSFIKWSVHSRWKLQMSIQFFFRNFCKNQRFAHNFHFSTRGRSNAPAMPRAHSPNNKRS